VVDSPCFHAVDATAWLDRLRYATFAWAGAYSPDSW
jgi:hypothetical protein